MAISRVTPKQFLGAAITNPKVYAAKIQEIIDVVNALSASTAATDATVAALDAVVSAGAGISGTFTSADTPGLTVTVTDGIITGIV